MERMGQIKIDFLVHSLQRRCTLSPLESKEGFDKQQRARVPSGQTKLLAKGRSEIVSRRM